MKTSKIILANNTDADIVAIGADVPILEAIRNGSTELPEEIADLFELKLVEVDDGIRGVLYWKED